MFLYGESEDAVTSASSAVTKWLTSQRKRSGAIVSNDVTGGYSTPLLAAIRGKLSTLGVIDVDEQRSADGQITSISFTALGELLMHRATAAVYEVCRDFLAQEMLVQPPRWWKKDAPSPSLVPVAEGTDEFEFVKERFHVHGFAKPILAVERVQV